MKKRSQVVLAGDIGGTKSRLGLFRVEGRRYELLVEGTYLSRPYPGIEQILEQFLRGKESVDSVCLGVPGPVTGGRIRVTNLPWLIDRQSIQKRFKLKPVEIINDLVANAYGIALLKKRDLKTLNRGRAREGNMVLLSAGTGLGEAIMFWDGTRHIPSPSEGSHVDFGPKNRLEMELWSYLLPRFGRVSYERVLSGHGLLHIYQFLKESKRLGSEPKWLSQRLEQEDPAAVISEAARTGRDRRCAAALDLFASIYGSEAGNLALKAMAVGGVYLGGGIAPKILWKLEEGGFIEAFQSKGRLSETLKTIPVKIILNDRAALLGAAHRAMSLLI